MATNSTITYEVERIPSSLSSRKEAKQSGDIAKFWKIKKRKEKLVPAQYLTGKLFLAFALHRYFTFPLDYDQRANIKREDLANSGFFFAYDYKSLQCFFCTFEITTLEGWKGLTLEEINKRHIEESKAQFSGNCCPLFTGCAEVENVPIVNPNNYNFESHRLYSLLKTPFCNSNVTPYDLAANGFYYTGSEDNCRCHYCKLEVRGWEPGDTAHGEHKRWNPSCVFLKQNSTLENVAIGQELQSNLASDCAHPFKKANFDKYGSYLKVLSNQLWITIEAIGIILTKEATYNNFCTVLKRTESFADWPKQLAQRPQELIDAGFFYTGTGDRVLCFQCGGGLKDWDARDAPLAEHAKWFPTCSYLKLKMDSSSSSSLLPDVCTDSMMSDSTTNDDSNLSCKICKKSTINCVNLPCGHMDKCDQCFNKTNICNVCKKTCLAYVETFI